MNEIDAGNVENREVLKKKNTCDKYDYLAAAACGAVGGMIDIFFVGAPGDSKLGKWTDKQVDNAVMGFAKIMGWNPKERNLSNVNSAVGFLERTNKVNYDQRKPEDVGGVFNIAPSTHHMMSLGHSPDVVGLFFSILNQFTATSSFIADGKLITVTTDTFELRGGNFVMKIMCGIANWLGHLMSDVSGSSGAHGRGTGIVMPFYEFFGLCKFGDFSTENGKKDFAEITMQAFTRGYDFRFGMTQAIPVMIAELSIRLIWALRQRFQYHKQMEECIPTMKHAELRVMLIVGNGMLCVIDGLDAAIRSGGNFLKFFMRLNLVAWCRLVLLILKEIALRYGMGYDELLLEYRKINRALDEYIECLRNIDYKKYEEELVRLGEINALLKMEGDGAQDAIYKFLESEGVEMQFHNFEEFDEKMQEKDFVLKI